MIGLQIKIWLLCSFQGPDVTWRQLMCKLLGHSSDSTIFYDNLLEMINERSGSVSRTNAMGKNWATKDIRPIHHLDIYWLFFREIFQNLQYFLDYENPMYFFLFFYVDLPLIEIASIGSNIVPNLITFIFFFPI